MHLLLLLQLSLQPIYLFLLLVCLSCVLLYSLLETLDLFYLLGVLGFEFLIFSLQLGHQFLELLLQLGHTILVCLVAVCEVAHGLIISLHFTVLAL